MNSELTENVQDAIRPGEMVDTFYYGETNMEKQAYPCVVNNKFVQQFSTPGQGTSQFVISPYQGVSDIVLYFKLPAGAANGDTTAYLPQGWGYNLIRQVSVRYGSSAQYYFTGAQIELQNLFDSEDGLKRNALSSLGGNLVEIGDLPNTNNEAYIYLNLPHNSPRADGKPLPFPSDLLVQPIIVTIELNSLASLLLARTAATFTSANLATAQLQVKQEMLQDSSDLLARRVDMNSHAYTYPLKYFPQQEVLIPVGDAGEGKSVNLTGFRAGEVRNILLWLTPQAAGTDIYGSGIWYAPSQVLLTYNGEIFYRADSSSSQIWNLISDTKSSGVDLAGPNAVALYGGDGIFQSQWVDVPFAQVNVPYDKECKLVHGKPILNAVVNLSFTAPTLPAGATAWMLHAVYLYNSSLLCSRGSAEYVF